MNVIDIFFHWQYEESTEQSSNAEWFNVMDREKAPLSPRRLPANNWSRTNKNRQIVGT